MSVGILSIETHSCTTGVGPRNDEPTPSARVVKPEFASHELEWDEAYAHERGTKLSAAVTLLDSTATGLVGVNWRRHAQGFVPRWSEEGVRWDQRPRVRGRESQAVTTRPTSAMLAPEQFSGRSCAVCQYG